MISLNVHLLFVISKMTGKISYERTYTTQEIFIGIRIEDLWELLVITVDRIYKDIYFIFITNHVRSTDIEPILRTIENCIFCIIARRYDIVTGRMNGCMVMYIQYTFDSTDFEVNRQYEY